MKRVVLLVLLALLTASAWAAEAPIYNPLYGDSVRVGGSNVWLRVMSTDSTIILTAAGTGLIVTNGTDSTTFSATGITGNADTSTAALDTIYFAAGADTLKMFYDDAGDIALDTLIIITDAGDTIKVGGAGGGSGTIDSVFALSPLVMTRGDHDTVGVTMSAMEDSMEANLDSLPHVTAIGDTTWSAGSSISLFAAPEIRLLDVSATPDTTVSYRMKDSMAAVLGDDWVPSIDSTNSRIVWQAQTGGSGEATTASNKGTTLDSVFYQETGDDLEFRRLKDSTGVVITPSGDTALSFSFDSTDIGYVSQAVIADSALKSDTSFLVNYLPLAGGTMNGSVSLGNDHNLTAVNIVELDTLILRSGADDTILFISDVNAGLKNVTGTITLDTTFTDLRTLVIGHITDSLDEYSLTTAVTAFIEDSLNEYWDSTASNDSLDALRTLLSAEIADSLDEYSLTSAISTLIADSLDEYWDSTASNDSLDALRTWAQIEIADSLDEYTVGADDYTVKSDTAGDGTNVVTHASSLVIQEGSNITLTEQNDTLTITGAAGGSGTEDTTKFMQDTGTTVITSISNEIVLKPGNGLDGLFDTDTLLLHVDGTEIDLIGDTTGTDPVRMVLDDSVRFYLEPESVYIEGPIYIGDSASADSIATTMQHVKLLVEDSLNEYSLTSAIQTLIADSLDEYSLTSAISTLIADSLDEYWDSTVSNDSLDALRTLLSAEIADSLDEYSLTSAISVLIADSLDEYWDSTAANDSLDAMRTLLAAEIADSLDEYSLTTAITALIEDSLNEYWDSTASNDSLDAMRTLLSAEIADSLDEYSLTTAIRTLIADSLDEYSLTTAIRTLIADSLDEYPDTVALNDSLALYGTIAGETWTGTHDFGGATSLEVPNGAAPTVDAAGEIAQDTDSADAIVIYDGTAARRIPTLHPLNITIIDPQNLVDSEFTVFHFDSTYAPGGATIARIAVNTRTSTTAVVRLYEFQDETNTGAVLIDTLYLNSATRVRDETLQHSAIEQGDFLAVSFGSGTPKYLHIEVWYYLNQ